MLKGRQLAFRIARATWVHVELQAAEFDAFLDEIEPALSADILKEMAADLFLACACLAGNEVALAEFDSQVLRAAIRAVEQISSEPEFVAHCKGVLWQRLFSVPQPHLKQYRGQDTLLRWVCVLATGTALRAQQQRTPHQAMELTQLYMLASSDSDLAALHAGLGRSLNTAISEALGRLTPSERNVLRMHLAGDCTLDQIGRAYGVHRATAARWLSEARSKVDAAVVSSLAPQTAALPASRSNSETQRRAALGYDDSRAPSSSQPGGAL